MIEFRNAGPQSTPDVYFTSQYGHADAAFAGGEWRTLSDPAGEWQMPVVITKVGDDLEALSPYGYSGIYIASGHGEEQSRIDWAASRELLDEASVVSLFLRFSPLDAHSVALAATLPGLKIVRSGSTYLNKISTSDAIWSSMEGRARTAIRKARNEGMTAQVRQPELADLEVGSPFRDLYEGTMRRVEAHDRYFFDDQYLRALLENPTSPLHLAEVSVAGEVVAACLVLQHGEIAHYHLSGSDSEAARSGANALLIWAVLEWCSENAIQRCHLGGGLSDDDGLAKFKRSFGGERVDFFTGRAVIDEDRYERLTMERASVVGKSVDELKASTYFPAYRAGG